MELEMTDLRDQAVAEVAKAAGECPAFGEYIATQVLEYIFDNLDDYDEVMECLKDGIVKSLKKQRIAIPQDRIDQAIESALEYHEDDINEAVAEAVQAQVKQLLKDGDYRVKVTGMARDVVDKYMASAR